MAPLPASFSAALVSMANSSISVPARLPGAGLQSRPALAASLNPARLLPPAFCGRAWGARRRASS